MAVAKTWISAFSQILKCEILVSIRYVGHFKAGGLWQSLPSGLGKHHRPLPN